MTCNEIKLLLSVYQDNEIEKKKPEIQSHLIRCDSCRREFEQLEMVRNKIKNLGEIDPSPDFTPLVMEKIIKSEKSRLFSLPSVVYSLVFIVIFVIGFLVNIDFKSEISRKNPDVWISDVLLQSQNLNLLFIQDKTIDMISSEGTNER